MFRVQVDATVVGGIASIGFRLGIKSRTKIISTAATVNNIQLRNLVS